MLHAQIINEICMIFKFLTIFKMKKQKFVGSKPQKYTQDQINTIMQEFNK